MGEIIPQSNHDVGIKAYFTEGELLPWKGRWFRVHLNATSQRIELEMLKPTERSAKVGKREQRWLRQHPCSRQAEAGRLKTIVENLPQHLQAPSLVAA